MYQGLQGHLQGFETPVILMIHKTFRTIFCGLMRQTLNFSEGLSPVISDVKLTQQFIKNVLVIWMFWGYFASSGSGCFVVIDGTMNSVVNEKILK